LEEALDVLRLARSRDDRSLTQATLSLRRFLGEDMALERSHALHLPEPVILKRFLAPLWTSFSALLFLRI